MPESVSPILASSDLDATAGFYAPLGFEVEGHFPDEYLLLRRGAIGLHFFFAGPSWDPSTNDSGAYLYVDDVEAWAAAAADAGVPDARTGFPRLHPPGPTPYGLREMALLDPDGNLLRIASPEGSPQG